MPVSAECFVVTPGEDLLLTDGGTPSGGTANPGQTTFSELPNATGQWLVLPDPTESFRPYGVTVAMLELAELPVGL